MLNLAGRLKPGDREKHGWSSEGIVKKSIKKAKRGQKPAVSVRPVYPCNSVCGYYKMVMPAGFCGDLRSGGPALKATQSYPPKFCRTLAELHKKYCIDTGSTPSLPDLGRRPDANCINAP